MTIAARQFRKLSLLLVVLVALPIGAAIWPRRAPSGAFAPDDVSGLILWVETDSGVSTDAFGVYDWADQSTSGNDFTQSTDGFKPSLVTDHFATGCDGILGDDSDDRLTLNSTISEAADISIFFVVQLEKNAFEYVIGSTATDQIQATSTEALRVRWGQSGFITVTSTAAFSPEQKILVDLHRDGSDNWTGFINAVDKTTGTPVDAGNVNLTDILEVNGNAAGHYFGAILVYDNKVSTADAASIRTYLNDKCSLY